MLSEGTPLARIYDLYGSEQAVVAAPCDRLAFGMLTDPTVNEGEWADFGEIQERIGA